jgi:hypothetical protein
VIVVFEGMRNAYDPGMTRLRALLPQVGTVRLVSFGQSQRSARYDLVLAGETPNIFDPALAGGRCSIWVSIRSAPRSSCSAPACGGRATATIATGADGAGAAVLSYDGFVVQIAFSKIGASRRPNEIQGELGTIEIDEITAPRRITLDLFSGVHEEIGIDGPDDHALRGRPLRGGSRRHRASRPISLDDAARGRAIPPVPTSCASSSPTERRHP